MARMEDDALFSNLRDKLFTAVVGDVLDKMGWQRQFLPQAIKPLRPEMKVIGRAMPVLEADIIEDRSPAPGGAGAKPFGLMLEALDDLRPNEVYIATGGSFRYRAADHATHLAIGGSPPTARLETGTAAATQIKRATIPALMLPASGTEAKRGSPPPAPAAPGRLSETRHGLVRCHRPAQCWQHR